MPLLFRAIYINAQEMSKEYRLGSTAHLIRVRSVAVNLYRHYAQSFRRNCLPV